MNTGIFGLLSESPALAARSPFHYWQGQSGRWHVTTVFPLLNDYISSPSVYLFVRRDPNGSAHALYIGQTENTTRRMREHMYEKTLQAILLGANELHLHLLAESEAVRISIETDLRNGHASPLNKQHSSATPGGLIGLGSLYVR